MSISVDTISIAERLQAVGVEELSARTLAQELRYNNDDAATKADIGGLGKRIDASDQAHKEDITSSEQRLEKRIDASDQAHKEDIGGLEKRIDASDQAHKEDIGGLEKRIDVSDQARKADIAGLGKRIDASDQVHKEDIDGLGKRIDASDQACEEAVTSSEQRLGKRIDASDQARKEDSSLLRREMGVLRWMVAMSITLVSVCMAGIVAILVVLANAS